MSLKETINHIKLYEASLGRLKQHYDNGDCILFISANRNENTIQENKKAFKELQHYIYDSNFGHNKIKGSYVENREDGTTVTVEEDSLIVYGKPKDEITLLRLGKQLGRRYKQEAILFINSEGKAKYYNLLTDSAIELGRFIYTRVGDYFSTIGKKQFSFSILESVEPERQYMRGFLQEAFRSVINSYEDGLTEWANRSTKG